MSQSLTLSIYEIVGSSLCVASDDGQKVHDRIAVALREGRQVALSFRNVSSLTSAFLNAAIGQLYGEFTEDRVRSLLKVQDMPSEDLALLKRVVDMAKEYFKNPDRFRQATRQAMEETDEE